MYPLEHSGQIFKHSPLIVGNICSIRSSLFICRTFALKFASGYAASNVTNKIKGYNLNLRDDTNWKGPFMKAIARIASNAPKYVSNYLSESVWRRD